MKASAKLPQQERSRRTLDELLNACIRVLDRTGLEACTVPLVAAEAKVAAGTIYRRFADKDDLLRAAFLHVLEGSNLVNEERLPKMVFRPTLAETAERIVAAILQQYRSHPRLLRGLAHYMFAEPDGHFAREAARLVHSNLGLISGLLLRHRESIHHERPEQAALFAVLTATSAIELMALEPNSMWMVALKLSDQAIVKEHARAMVAYLQQDTQKIHPPARPARVRRAGKQIAKRVPTATTSQGE